MDNAPVPAGAPAEGPASAAAPAGGFGLPPAAGGEAGAPGPGQQQRRPRTLGEKLKKRLGSMLLRGAFASLVIQVAGLGSAFVFQAFLARVLGPAAFGNYIYAMTLLTVFAVFARMGVDTAATRYVAAYNATNELGFMRGFLRRAWRAGVISSLVTGALVAAAAAVLHALGYIDEELLYLFWLLAIVIPINARLEISNAALLAFKQVVRAKGPGTLLRPALIAAAVYVIAFVLHRPVSSVLTMELYLGSVVIITALNGVFLHRALPAGYASAEPEYKIAEWRKTMMPFFILAAVGMLNNSIDVILIGPLRGTTEAGIYSVATRFVRLISFGLIAVNSIFPAMISEFYTQKRMKELQRLVTLSSRVACAFAVPMSLVLIFGGKQIMGYYGGAFQEGYWPMLILTIGQIVNASTGSVGYLLAITGREKLSVRILLGSLALNVIANLSLVPHFGMMGAAVGTTVAMTVSNVAMVVAVRITMGLKPTAIGGTYAPPTGKYAPAET